MSPVLRRRRHRFAFLGIILLAALLRFHDLGSKSLWSDELATLRVSDLPAAGDIISSLRDYSPIMNNHPPVYFLAVHAVSKVSQGEAALRFTSACAGVAAVYAFFWLSRLFVPRRHALCLAFLLAVSPLAVFFSQENRSYALLLLETTLMALGLFAYLKYGRRRSLALFAGATLLAIYTNYVSILFLACAFAAAALRLAGQCVKPRLRRRALRRGWILGLVSAFVLLGYAPWMATLADFFTENAFTEGTPFQVSDAAIIWSNLLDLPRGLGFVPWLMMGLFILSAAANRRSDDLFLVLPICVLPIVILLIFKPHLFYDRYLLFMLPFLLLMAYRAVVYGALRMAGRHKLFLGATAVLAWLAMTTIALLDYYGSEKQDWRTAVAYLEENRRAGDTVIPGLYFVEDAIMYYGDRGPGEILVHLNAFHPDGFHKATASSPRTWYMTSYHRSQPAWVLDILDVAYELQVVVPGDTPISIYLKDDEALRLKMPL